jgi:hypothetical protein
MKNNLESIPYNKCTEWIVLDSMFKLPDWIEFMDIEELQKNIQNQMPSEADIQKLMKQAQQ